MSLATLPLKEPTTLKKITGGALAAGLGLCLLGVNVAQTLSLVLRPFSSQLFRKFNRGCAYFFWGLCARVTLYRYRIAVPVTGEPLPPKENALIIANHQAMSDILAMMVLGRREKALGGMKWFVKESLKWVPGIGWGLQFLDCLFVSRNWATDGSRIRKVFQSLLRFDFPFWVITFSEGTRLTPEKLARSQGFCRRKGFPVFERVLLPRTKGFVASVTALRPRLNAIYDVTFGYPEGIPTLSDFFLGRVHRICIHVRRFPIHSIPEESADLEKWLIQRFAEKDDRLKKFATTGAFI